MNYYDFYITPEEYAIAEKNGIDNHTLEQRIRYYGWDKDKALNTPKKIRINRYEGYLKIAKENNLSKSLFYSRISSGWDALRAATTPKMKNNGAKSKFSDEVIAKYKENGISPHTFRWRIRNGWSVEDACTQKTMNKDEVLKTMWRKRNIVY